MRTYWLEARLEFVKNLRLPVYSLSTLLFPVMVYVMFGLSFGDGTVGAVSRQLYLAVSYSAFGVVGACLFGFGVNIAAERGQGWLLPRRASPAPPLAYFVAKMFMAAMFSLAIIAMLMILGFTFGGVAIAPGDLAALVGVLLVGSLPFSAMGVALGYLSGPNSAPAVVNLLYLPMAFAGGMWVPVQFLPEVIQTVAPYLPTYHFTQLALAVVGAGAGNAGHHLLILGLTTAACLAAAVVVLRR